MALALAALLLLLLAVVTSRVGGLGHGRAAVVAAVRAVVQLAAVSAVVAAVLASVPLALVFLGVMAAVASGTSARRLTRDRSGAWAGLAVLGGALPVVGLLVATGAVPLSGRALLPVGGIVIGGAMTATTLAGRRALDAVRERRGEVEAGLAIGLPARDAHLEVSRPAAAEAVVPGLDQTRTVGLVTLPGAFVGMLLGGATPTEAGVVQAIVLVSLLAAQMLSALLAVELVARGLVRRR